MHGYDLVNPLEINPDIGTLEEFILFSKKLKDKGLGLIIDFVPNHMCIGSDDNIWWQDVLKNGLSSPCAKFFDIKWKDGKVVIPPIHHSVESNYVRTVDWRSSEINYRKFFDIFDYAGIRIEDPEVYKQFHSLIFKLKEWVDGLRIDHIDGLYDPYEYLQKLHHDFPCYTLVEKILIGNETLPDDWKVEGTVGYDFLNAVNGVFIYQPNQEKFIKLYHEFTKVDTDVEEISYTCKKFVLENSLNSDVMRIADGDEDVKTALTEIIALFPVYRTYIRPFVITEKDKGIIQKTIAKAKKRNPTIDFDKLKSRLLSPEKTDFVQRFQQVTGPAMAKGMEDTAFYRYFPLASLDEVGNELDLFGISLEEFHNKNQERRPHSMLALSTHDTKRSEDVRARLNVLSEMPEIWHSKVREWHQMNKVGIDRNEEYLLYQTLVGSWQYELSEEYVRRIRDYMRKAISEAKINSSWNDPHEEYLKKSDHFINGLFANASFVKDLTSFVRFIEPFSIKNSLSQTFLKLTSPGVPDTYQGCENWNFSLVDPDNRRPVDFNLAKTPSQKLFLTKKILECRNQYKDLFTYGTYHPIYAEGPFNNHVIAFMRKHENQTATCVAGRFFSFLPSWKDTTIFLSEPVQNAFTKEVFQATVPVKDLFKTMPIALLF